MSLLDEAAAAWAEFQPSAGDRPDTAEETYTDLFEALGNRPDTVEVGGEAGHGYDVAGEIAARLHTEVVSVLVERVRLLEAECITLRRVAAAAVIEGREAVSLLAQSGIVPRRSLWRRFLRR